MRHDTVSAVRMRNFNPRTREGCDEVVEGFFTAARQRDFNPRTREGCDCRQGQRFRAQADISIHAPVKGATWTWGFDVATNERFQSTHP